MQVAVLSPHLDDAVLSCWHLLASSDHVGVINIFTGIPAQGRPSAYWDRMTGAADSVERMRERLAEDERALAFAGRRAEYLGFLDGQYRQDAPTGIPEAVGARLPDGAAVFAPAGIGGHADHVLVRDVGLALAASGREVSLYADIPYATEFGWPAWMTDAVDPLRDVDAYWERFVPDGYTPSRIELDEDAQRRKVEAMHMYRTQFSVLEAGPLCRLTHPALLPFEVSFSASAVRLRDDRVHRRR
jgi:LmbE family N-acetylglucosaminyl deacetylase